MPAPAPTELLSQDIGRLANAIDTLAAGSMMRYSPAGLHLEDPALVRSTKIGSSTTLDRRRSCFSCRAALSLVSLIQMMLHPPTGGIIEQKLI